MNEILNTLGLVPFFTQQLDDPNLIETRVGRVMSVERSKTTVLCASGEKTVELSPNLRQADTIDRPTVGDWVILDEACLRIEKVLERKSLFKRVAAGTSTAFQPIAANIDTLFIVSSCNEEFKESRLERYLALCSEAGATPVIILTKADLIDDSQDYIRRAQKTKVGVAVEAINALDDASMDCVRAWIGKKSTVALVGSSGVGKSTILNTLAGRPLASTGNIREDDKKGRHTTTHRELHILPSGGLLIDVPGMRELKVANIEESIDTVFNDIDNLAARCKFADCQHDTEPGCAVQVAINEGKLDERRLRNYKKLLRENRLTSATLAERRAKERDFAKVVKSAKAIKKQQGEN